MPRPYAATRAAAGFRVFTGLTESACTRLGAIPDHAVADPFRRDGRAQAVPRRHRQREALVRVLLAPLSTPSLTLYNPSMSLSFP